MGSYTNPEALPKPPLTVSLHGRTKHSLYWGINFSTVLHGVYAWACSRHRERQLLASTLPPARCLPCWLKLKPREQRDKGSCGVWVPVSTTTGDTHTHFLSLSGLCARVAHSCLLCSHQACLWPKLRPFKRQEASAGMWLSPMRLTTMWQLRVCAPGGKSALGWEELRRGSPQAVSGHVPTGCRDGGNMEKAQKKSKPPPADVGTVTKGPSLADVYCLRRWGGRCWQWLHPVLETAGKVQFSHWGGNSQAWCSFAGTVSMCWMKWFLSYSGKLHSAFRDSSLHTSGECFTFTFSGAVGSMVQHTCPNSWVPGHRPSLFIQPWAQ